MMVAILAALVLSLLTSGQSAPLTGCGSLTKRLEGVGRDQLLGQWRHIAESTSVPMSATAIKMLVESVWGQITAGDKPDTLIIKKFLKTLGKCFSLQAEATLNNNTVKIEKSFDIVEVFLPTSCSDCLVVLSETTIGVTKYSGLQLLSRRDTVVAAELDQFKKQVACLDLPEPVVLDTERGFCLNDSSVQDLTPGMNMDLPELMAHIPIEYLVDGLLKLLTG